MSRGEMVGRRAQSEKTLLVTQKSCLFTPVPIGSVPGVSCSPSPSSALASAVAT